MYLKADYKKLNKHYFFNKITISLYRYVHSTRKFKEYAITSLHQTYRWREIGLILPLQDFLYIELM